MAYRWLFYEWTNKVMNTERVKKVCGKWNPRRKFYVWYILLREKEVELTDEYRKYKKGL